MKRVALALTLVSALAFYTLSKAIDETHASLPPTPYDQAVPARVNQDDGQLSQQFEGNYGQTDSRVKFLSRGSGYSLFLTATEAVLALRKPAAPKASEGPFALHPRETKTIREPQTELRVRLASKKKKMAEKARR